MTPMYRSLSSVKASLDRAVGQVYNRAGRAIPRKRWQPLDEVQRFNSQVQGIPDSSSIGQVRVSAIARGIEAERVMLFLPQPNRDELVIAASEGAGDFYSMSLQPRSPFLISFEEQHRVMAAEEIYPLPQWHGTPLANRRPSQP